MQNVGFLLIVGENTCQYILEFNVGFLSDRHGDRFLCLLSSNQNHWFKIITLEYTVFMFIILVFQLLYCCTCFLFICFLNKILFINKTYFLPKIKLYKTIILCPPPQPPKPPFSHSWKYVYWNWYNLKIWVFDEAVFNQISYLKEVSLLTKVTNKWS